MSRKSLIYMVLGIFVISFIAGCETVPKKFKEEVGGIRSRVDTLETKVEGIEARQTDAERLASEQAQALEASRERVKTNISVKPRSLKGKENIRDIQTCLKNAGFYSGNIDGVSGKQTRRAIREFQKANGLNPDGIVGKKTWELLAKYSEGAESSEERATK